MKFIGITGYSGAGKTTLILKLIPALKAKGYKVSTLKHAHHLFDVDVEGKDSYEHRKYGASEVLISSSKRLALMSEHAVEPPLSDLLKKLSPVDFVLIEGFKKEHHPKLIVHREANNKPPLWNELSNVKAVISDIKTDFMGDTVHIDDIEAITKLVEKYAETL
jgi:molybdopterin-guanine dinucleotide biosynthesis adapter protein